MLTVGSLFSGIGGLDLGLERAGMQVRWQCEIDPYCRAVLRKHWPDVLCYEDIRSLRAAERVDLLCGGFPCPPVSVSGRRAGMADERWLWPEMRRVAALLRPRWVLIENVRGIATLGLREIMEDLEALSYQGTAYLFSACTVGAPHPRERVFVVADTLGFSAGLEEQRSSGSKRGVSQASAPALVRRDNGAMDAERRPSRLVFPRWSSLCGWDAPEPLLRRVDDGIPSRVDRLRALGNAVVPQVAEYVGRLIVDREEAIHA